VNQVDKQGSAEIFIFRVRICRKNGLACRFAQGRPEAANFVEYE
jgi:hypothetical protein